MSEPVEIHQRLISTARTELEASGNPAYGLVTRTQEGYEFSPMVYAALRPAMDAAARASAGAEPADTIFIVSRAMDGERIAFTIMDPRAKKLHQQFEVIEKSISDEDSLL